MMKLFRYDWSRFNAQHDQPFAAADVTCRGGTGHFGRPASRRWLLLRLVLPRPMGRPACDGYHAQTNNRDNFLSTDFGLKEFNVKSKKERISRYRRYVYETVAVSRPEKGKAKVIGDRILEKERKREFELSRNDRFRYRTRYFTDSGVIGSKEFVSKIYRRFKHHFNSKNGKRPKPVKGLSGVYSLKRLSEAV